jgi:predicted glutamine amidotransferase
MCMLLGFSANRKYELSKCIKEFLRFSKKHPHGWGLAIFDKIGEEPHVIKEAIPAYLSNVAKTLGEGSIPGRLAIAHIRYATKGEVKYMNTHPFIQRIKGRSWILAHNGSIKPGIFKDLHKHPYGDTDSEKAFCYIAEELELLPENCNDN